MADAVGRLKLHRGLRTLTSRLTTLALRYNADPGCYESRSVQAESARRRALRILGFLRTHEKEPDLGEWAPKPWTSAQRCTALTDEPHVPKDQPTIDRALARSPSHWDGDVIAVEIAKAVRRARIRAKHRAKQIARDGRAKREQRLAKAARKFAQAQSQLQAARRREPETAEEVRAWHRRERLRCSHLHSLSELRAGLLPNQLPRLETDGDRASRLARAKRAREDRAGTRGRHACLCVQGNSRYTYHGRSLHGGVRGTAKPRGPPRMRPRSDIG